MIPWLYIRNSGLCLILSLLVTQCGKAQDFRASFSQGKILKIFDPFPEIPPASRTYELGIAYQTKGKKVWHQLYGFPRIGCSAFFFDFGNREIFGHAYAVMPYLDLRISKGRRFNSRFAFGATVAYFDRIFDAVYNPTNNVVGAKLSILAYFRLEAAWNIHSRLALISGVSYAHFSNSQTRVPNIGINIPSFSGGLAFRAKPSTIPPLPPLPSDSSAFTIYPAIKAGIGFASARAPNGPLYPVWIGSFSMNTTLNRKIRLKLGTEWFYTESIYAFLVNQDLPGENPKWLATGAVLFGGAEFMMGPLALNLQLGPYLKRPFRMDHFLYTKAGLHVYFSDQQKRDRNQFFLGIYVHAHAGQADFSDFSLGYVF